MGRTTVTPAKKKLLKDDMRKKSKEVHRAQVNKISDQIETCKELDVVSDRKIIPVIGLVPTYILKAIVSWFFAVYAKTGDGKGNEYAAQSECEKELKRAKPKKIKARPKKGKIQTGAPDIYAEQHVDVSGGEEDMNVADEQLSLATTTSTSTATANSTLIQLQPKQDDSDAWIVAKDKREEKRRMKKRLGLSSPPIPTSFTPDKPRQNLSPRFSTRQARKEAGSSFPARSTGSIPFSHASEPTKEAIPPEINPWQRKIDLDIQLASPPSIIEELEASQTELEQAVKEEQNDEESGHGQGENNLCSHEDTAKLVKGDLEEPKSSGRGVPESEIVTIKADIAMNGPLNNYLSEKAESTDELKAQAAASTKLEDKVTIKGQAVIISSLSKENDTPKRKSWSELEDESEQEQDEAYAAIRAHLLRDDPKICKPTDTNLVLPETDEHWLEFHPDMVTTAA